MRGDLCQGVRGTIAQGGDLRDKFEKFDKYVAHLSYLPNNTKRPFAKGEDLC